MIGWYVHHQGMGHLQRLRAVATHLRTPATGFSSLPAPDDWAGPWVRLPPDAEPAPAADDDIAAHGRLHWAPLRHSGYRERMGSVAAWIDAVRPTAMVVDVSVEVAVLCRALGVPVAIAGMRGDRFDPAHRLAYDLAETIIVPWAQTTAEPQWPQEWLDKTVHCGALSVLDDRADALLTSAAGVMLSDRATVLCLLGYGGTEVTAADIAAARAATPGWNWTFPTPGEDPAPLLVAADVVVAHAGQGAVAEVAALRRPAVVVAQERPHDEQLATAAALRRIGIATAVDRWPRADAWPGLLEAARAAGGSGWERWSDRNGARRFAAAVDDVADRYRR